MEFSLKCEGRHPLDDGPFADLESLGRHPLTPIMEMTTTTRTDRTTRDIPKLDRRELSRSTAALVMGAKEFFI
jgi:hypothetical protein